MQVELELQPQTFAARTLDRAALEHYARQVIALAHPSLLRVFDVLTDEQGRWALVRQAVCGNWLAPSRVTDDTTANPPLACSLILSISEALAYLHQIGFRGGTSLSWEESVRYDREGDRWCVGVYPPTPNEYVLTESASATGIPGFIAPELILDPAPPSPASDSFTLGAMLFGFLAGERLIGADSAVKRLQATVAGGFRTLAQVHADIPDALSSFVARTLDSEPARRPSFREWGFMMEEFGGRQLPLPGPPEGEGASASPALGPHGPELSSVLPQGDARGLLRTLGRPLGRGGMASTWRGEWEEIAADPAYARSSREPEPKPDVDEDMERSQLETEGHMGDARAVEPLVPAVAKTPEEEDSGPRESRTEPVGSASTCKRDEKGAPPGRGDFGSDGTVRDLNLDRRPDEPDPKPYLDEDVQFTVYRPKHLLPMKWEPLLAFAHLSSRPPDADDEPDPVEEVKRQAATVLGDATEDYQNLAQDSRRAVPREGEITFVPTMEGVEFNPPSRSFLWQESVHREEFRMRAAASLNGRTARGRMTVFLGSIILAEIDLAIPVSDAVRKADSRANLTPASAQPYHDIFASYSHADETIVLEYQRFVESVGHQYLRDCVSLRAGQEWSHELENLIDKADIFQLFWSSNSMRSPFVEQEWRHALSLPRRRFVRPTYWEDPLPEWPERSLPSEELRRLHFHFIGRGSRTGAEDIVPQRDVMGRDGARDTAHSGLASLLILAVVLAALLLFWLFSLAL